MINLNVEESWSKVVQHGISFIHEDELLRKIIYEKPTLLGKIMEKITFS